MPKYTQSIEFGFSVNIHGNTFLKYPYILYKSTNKANQPWISCIFNQNKVKDVDKSIVKIKKHLAYSQVAHFIIKIPIAM